VVASGRKVGLLRETLRSLSRADGLQADSVLVSQSWPGQASRLAATGESRFAWIGPGDSGLAPGKAGDGGTSSSTFKK
ncbi:unnamed protein product, partial [Polarella glacialis]